MHSEIDATVEWPPLIQLGRTLAFFASAIKSGESWSPTCQADYDAASEAMKELYTAMNEASTQSTGGSEAVEVGDLPILARFEQILAQWAIDDRTPPILRDDLRRFLSWFSPIRSRLVASPPGGSEAVGVKRPHKWVKSTLGHGEQMCEYCKGTNRELAVLGELDHCTAAPPEGIAARDAVIEEQVQAVVAAVRPYTVATLFIEELSDLVRAAIRSPASSKDGNHA